LEPARRPGPNCKALLLQLDVDLQTRLYEPRYLGFPGFSAFPAKGSGPQGYLNLNAVERANPFASQVCLGTRGDVLREWSLAQACSPNWLRALNDPRIGPALALIHERPVKAWTVARLAKKVGYSRSPFTVRFKRVVGESPQGYITRVRLQRAAQMLKEGHDSLRAIALAAGYESESSFSKAFKRQFQKTPGHFRRIAPQGEGRGI
jgi:transcriptional regulator GlxA family with amidase domain